MGCFVFFVLESSLCYGTIVSSFFLLLSLRINQKIKKEPPDIRDCTVVSAVNKQFPYGQFEVMLRGSFLSE